jgi:hypothetical protein
MAGKSVLDAAQREREDRQIVERVAREFAARAEHEAAPPGASAYGENRASGREVRENVAAGGATPSLLCDHNHQLSP